MSVEITTSNAGPAYRSGSVLFVAFVILISIIAYSAREEKPYPGFKLFGKNAGEILNSKAKERFVKNGIYIMKKGFQESHGRAFQVISSTGPVIILPPSIIEEVRNMNHLSFSSFLEHDFFLSYPGLEAWQSVRNNIFQDMIKKNLASAVGPMTPVLSRVMSKVVDEILLAGKEWTEARFPQVALNSVSRLTAEVFIGESLCSNKEWLDLSVQFTTDAFLAVQALRSWPSFLRPLVHHFLSGMRTVRAQLAKGRRLIEPEEAARRRERRDALLSGKPMPKSKDALSWFFDVAGERKYDVVQGQMLLTFTAIHTTSMTLTALFYDLLENPEWIEKLREEMVLVIREDGGLTKLTLNKLKLLDSCMKESQRVSMIAAVLINRRVEKTTVLSDGTRLPKGATLGVPVFHMGDPTVWGPDADRFVGDRFLRMRQQPGHENKWQFVTVSAEHYGFGIGKQACPGRFMASNQIKIVMVHLLLKYDWKLNGGRPKSLSDVGLIPDPKDTVMCKARMPEIELGAATLDD